MTRPATERLVEIVVNGRPLQIRFDLTMDQLLRQLKLAKPGIAVELNQQLVPREKHAACRLREGDQIEVVTLVGGG